MSLCIGLFGLAACNQSSAKESSSETSIAKNSTSYSKDKHKKKETSSSTDLESTSSTEENVQSNDSSTGISLETEGSITLSAQESTQAIESTQPAETSQSQANNTWSSMDEAIQFYEETYKNPSNAISNNINWNNYNRNNWSLVENSGNRIVLHFSNVGGAGGSYTAFIKDGNNTQIINYDGNASYPNSPSNQYIVDNNNHLVK